MRMGLRKVPASSHSDINNNQTNVILNVYDLTPINKYSYWIGLGIFHSGIEVHGKEYGFGAHDFPFSGVFEVEPKCCPGFTYRCSISMGTLNMSSDDFRLLIENMTPEYHGNTYDLVDKNCNHFTNDIVHKLTGKRIPGWVNRLARLGSIFSCLLPKSLRATKVKKVPEFLEGDGTETLPTAATNESSEITDVDEKLLSPKDGNLDINFVIEAQADSKKR